MKLGNYIAPTILYFIAAALLIAYFFPREGAFRYQFYEGKPWRYGLLTAPNDFPIYKTDEKIKEEKDSVSREFNPYYKINLAAGKKKSDLLNATKNTFKPNVTQVYIRYIEKTLDYLYKTGIINTRSLEELKKERKQRINIIDNNIAELRYTSDFFTIKTAYEFMINNCPPNLDQEVLRSCDINNFLTENVVYDKEMSEKIYQDILQKSPVANGMVQAGQRIVDRGEIIDHQTYNVLRSLKIVYESRTGGAERQYLIMAGQFILVFGVLACFWIYLWSFRRKIFNNRKHTIFLLLCIFVVCVLTELCVTYKLFNIYILPFAIVPIVVRTFFDSRTALFTHITVAMLCSLMVPFPHEFLLLQIIAGMVVTFGLRDLSERAHLIRCAFLIFMSYSAAYVGMTLYLEANLDKIKWIMLLYFGINFILLMFTYILVYILEKTFGYISSITLVELSNINTPVLKKLSETAPGTFQHSLQVSILATEAASKIEADTQLVRTGALYHDIGKMTNPAFFTENQGSVDPHAQLTFEQSALIIIGHVSEGVRIAEKAQLPKAIINFIRTHHGKGKVKYFYNSFRNKYPDKEVNEELFTYPGPNPFTKEMAIVMMADSVEATSRSLKEHTEEKIGELVNRIIDSQISDGLMKNAPLTFRDIENVKAVFIEKLKTMYHTRISYPDLVTKTGQR